MESFASLAAGGNCTSTSKLSFLELPIPAAVSTPELIPPTDRPHHSWPAPLYQLLAGPPSMSRHGHQAAPAVLQLGDISPAEAEAIKADIMAHPRYSALLAAYVGCRKVGAPPDVVDKLSGVSAKLDASHGQGRRRHEPRRHADPELDRFMEAYCSILVKYTEELARPMQEAAEFFKSVETQLDSIADSNICEGTESSEEEQDTSSPEEMHLFVEDRELKHQLLSKYGGSLSILRQEFSKRTKKGKLPREARQKLLQWWELHYTWPYPSEAEKTALAESTGLDQKQINNWFINQRKRHWKPAIEGGTFPTIEAAAGGGLHAGAALPLYVGRPFVMDGMHRYCPGS